ncbi:HSP20-like chaperone [Karstenula rhodostoma CBS 690.94]|uniref:HSP20-like chaperone n=1 Tax=Karstenula rhodostoma CBS 690.94 TaxID=1392251 RepID=A0A9P4U8U6_9PLEO|nr:HSP20-like chaperone [Karstenula rhodostoma CBS 690.94]
MQALRTTVRKIPSRLNRIHKRSLSTTPTMSLFPRFTQEFAPLFRLMDDYDRRVVRPDFEDQFRSVKAFTPKFDVKEVEDAYELHGEFPGIDQKDINIEWTDSNTLTVSGRHETVREEGERPVAAIEGAPAKDKQPFVEEEGTEGKTVTPAAEGGQQVAKQNSQEVAKNEEAPKHRYWVSERSVGEFHRSFSFPQRVDQEAVKASLKNGILSILVPKTKAPHPRKVTIE